MALPRKSRHTGLRLAGTIIVALSIAKRIRSYLLVGKNFVPGCIMALPRKSRHTGLTASRGNNHCCAEYSEENTVVRLLVWKNVVYPAA